MNNQTAAAVEPLWSTFHQDMCRHTVYLGRTSVLRRLTIFGVNQALWALWTYRFGRMVKTRRLPVVGPVLWILYRLLEAPTRTITGIYLDVDARIGPGLFLGHFGGTYIGPGVVMGRNCNVGQTCFVGASGDVDRPGAPILGDRVYVGVGSKVIGQVVIANGVAIGANAAVMDDLPENATAVGNPATVINYNGSNKYIRTMDDTP
ncbi:MAG TPA: serine acetyltransferase [Armatimonadota bacterium]